MLAATQRQGQGLPTREQKEAGRVSAVPVRQGSEESERQWNHLPEELQIVWRDAAFSDREDDGVEEHGPERKLLG